MSTCSPFFSFQWAPDLSPQEIPFTCTSVWYFFMKVSNWNGPALIEHQQRLTAHFYYYIAVPILGLRTNGWLPKEAHPVTCQASILILWSSQLSSLNTDPVLYSARSQHSNCPHNRAHETRGHGYWSAGFEQYPVQIKETDPTIPPSYELSLFCCHHFSLFCFLLAHWLMQGAPAMATSEDTLV